MKLKLIFNVMPAIVLLFAIKSNAQSIPDIFFISKSDIKNYQIKEIKEFGNSELDANDYKFYQFNNKGQLTLYTDVGVFLSKENAMAGGDKYEYNTTGKLIYYEGNGDLGNGHQSNFALYGYDTRQLMFKINGYENSRSSNGGMEVTDLTTYNYSNDQKLNKIITYNIGKKHKTLTMEDLSKFSLNTKNAGQLNQLLNINKTATSRTYFFYDHNKVIGYYPVEKNNVDVNPVDTIYSRKKIDELTRLGFELFSKKYLNESVKRKVIEDCYKPIKSKDLIINNKSANIFLSHIDKKGIRYIVFEITDKNYLFYKLID